VMASSAGLSITGMSLNVSDIDVRTFGEVTTGSSCPGGAPDGHFGHFSRYKYGIGWLTNTDPGMWYQRVGFGPCWTIGPVNSNGGYDVD
jgi:hypothetical protein